MKYRPPPQRTCLRCGRKWSAGFATAMYRQLYGTDASAESPKRGRRRTRHLCQVTAIS